MQWQWQWQWQWLVEQSVKHVLVVPEWVKMVFWKMQNFLGMVLDSLYQYGIAEQKYLLCERVYSLYIHRTEEFEHLFKGRGNWQRKLCYFELWYYALCGLSALLAFVKDYLMWIMTSHFLWVVNFVSSVVLLSTPTRQIDTWVGRNRGNISHNEQKCGIANTDGKYTSIHTYTEITDPTRNKTDCFAEFSEIPIRGVGLYPGWGDRL